MPALPHDLRDHDPAEERRHLRVLALVCEDCGREGDTAPRHEGAPVLCRCCHVLAEAEDGILYLLPCGHVEADGGVLLDGTVRCELCGD
jgi:hypothetical protein